MTKIKHPTTPVFMMLAIACIAGLLFVSCNNNTGNTPSVLIPVPKDTSALAKIDHFIPLSTIKEFRRAFVTERDSLAITNPDLFITASEGFNKPALLQILKDPNCVGMRIYYGVTNGERKKKELRMILVGIDAQGKDILITQGAPAGTDVTQTRGGDEYGQCCHEQPIDLQ